MAFAAILIAQFETSFNTLSNKAKMNVILKKLEIMRKMERFHDVFGRVFRKVPFVSFFTLQVIRIKTLSLQVTLTHGNETDSEESDVSQNLIYIHTDTYFLSQESQKSVRRTAWDDLGMFIYSIEYWYICVDGVQVKPYVHPHSYILKENAELSLQNLPERTHSHTTA